MNQRFKRDADPKADSKTHLTFQKPLFTQREWNLAKHEYTWGDTSREQVITRSHWRRMRAERELWNRGEEDYWTGKVIEESWRWVLTEGSFAGQDLETSIPVGVSRAGHEHWKQWKVCFPRFLQRGLVEAWWAGGHAGKQGYGFLLRAICRWGKQAGPALEKEWQQRVNLGDCDQELKRIDTKLHMKKPAMKLNIREA